MGPPVVEVDGPAERASGELVSGNFFQLLGVKPHLGRLFTPDDGRTPGAHPLVVLSHGYWQRRFGGDPDVIGRSIRVNTRLMTIIGVTPPDFYGVELGFSPDLRLPIVMLLPKARLESPQESWLQIIGRLKPGVSREAAASTLDGIYQRFYETMPPDWPRDRRLTLLDAGHGIRRLQDRFAKPLTVLSGLAAAVLLLVCINVASLMTARAAAREREFSIRRALGAGRSRIVTQLLVEACLIAAAGGALGLQFAVWAAHALADVALPATTIANVDLGLDLRILAFTMGLSALVATVCGLAPAFATRRASLAGALASDSRQVVGGRARGRLALVAVQIALSFALLVGAGLFARTLANLRHADFGFQPENLMIVSFAASQAGFTQPQLRQFFDDVAGRVATLPGVQSASFAMMPLLGRGEWGSGLTLDTGEHDDRPGPGRNAIGSGFFRTIGTPIVAGREFTEADTAPAEKVAIVNESFARRYFDGRALGRRIGRGGPDGVADFTIVGIVRDGKAAFVRETSSPMWYVPYRQLEQVGGLVLHVRTTGPSDGVTNAIRAAVASINNRVPPFGAMSMEQQIAGQLVTERLLAGLSTVFAGVAIALAALGLYGVTAYITMARTREIGLRLALGATPAGIVALILRETVVVTVLGLGAGVLLAALTVESLRPLLFGIDPVDTTVMVFSAVAVALVTTTAAWLPARNAMRVSPRIALL